MPFLLAFKDAFRRPVVPSVLLVKTGAPAWVMSMDAIGGFRDAISISTATYNRTLVLIHHHPKPHQYSTFFDFYAWSFGKDFSVLTTNNPALWGMEQFEDFAGQSTPGLSVSKWDRLEYDEPLLDVLLAEWPRRFATTPPSWRSLALFRSLNMANAAAQIPAVVDVTSQSLGRSISLWVSAFEILAHPGDRDSGLKEVYRAFEQVNWLTDACKELTHSCYEGRRAKPGPKRNLACWVYGELYRARNDYMHGNAISDDRLVVDSGRSLFMHTLPLYRLLLTGFLGIELCGPNKPDASWYGYDYQFKDRQGSHERALAMILKPYQRS
jgi:hypothetical protein